MEELTLQDLLNEGISYEEAQELLRLDKKDQKQHEKEMKIENNIANILRSHNHMEAIYPKISDVYPGNKWISAESNATGNRCYWEFYERKNFFINHLLEENNPEFQDGYCAVFKKDDKNEAIFIANNTDLNKLESVANQLSEKVLDQRFLSWPPRAYNTCTGFIKGLGTGLGILALATTAVVVDMTIAKIPELDYEGIIVPLMDKYEEYVGPIFGTAFGVCFLGGLLGGKKFGEWADQERVKGLPHEKDGFSYGHYASDKIKSELELLNTESDKIKTYNILEQEKIDISKQDYNTIYRVINKDPGDIMFKMKYLKEFYKNVDIDKVVSVLSSNK